jgi:hypothetical protein
VASISTHFFSTSAGLAENVFIADPCQENAGSSGPRRGGDVARGRLDVNALWSNKISIYQWLDILVF